MKEMYVTAKTPNVCFYTLKSELTVANY